MIFHERELIHDINEEHITVVFINPVSQEFEEGMFGGVWWDLVRNYECRYYDDYFYNIDFREHGWTTGGHHFYWFGCQYNYKKIVFCSSKDFRSYCYEQSLPMIKFDIINEWAKSTGRLNFKIDDSFFCQEFYLQTRTVFQLYVSTFCEVVFRSRFNTLWHFTTPDIALLRNRPLTKTSALDDLIVNMNIPERKTFIYANRMSERHKITFIKNHFMSFTNMAEHLYYSTDLCNPICYVVPRTRKMSLFITDIPSAVKLYDYHSYFNSHINNRF